MSLCGVLTIMQNGEPDMRSVGDLECCGCSAAGEVGEISFRALDRSGAGTQVSTW